MNSIGRLLNGLPVIPVIVIDSIDAVDALGDALVAGGLPCAEVTLRTPHALEAIRRLAERPQMLVGAGSITTAEQAGAAVDAGARFIVSPGFSDTVISEAWALGVPALPGVATATEIMRALDAGIDVVKWFPAGLLGGPDGVRSVGAPFPNLRFVPTGGVRADNLANYLAIPSVLAVGGSWIVSADLVREGKFLEIERLTAEAVALGEDVGHARD